MTQFSSSRSRLFLDQSRLTAERGAARSLRMGVRVAGFACLVLASLETRALAAQPDSEASDSATNAMRSDFASRKFGAARKKLEAALRKCEKRGCSNAVRGEIYRDLGVVQLSAGKKKEARDAFKKSLRVDPGGRLSRDYATPEATSAFRELGGELEPEPTPEPEPAAEPAPKEASVELSTKSSEGHESHNWLSLSLQQDFMLHAATSPACGSSEYSCVDGDAEYTGPIYAGYGNRIEGGLGLATTRLLVGFDHVLGNNVALGMRLGFAFNGGPTVKNGSKFLPLHAELRAAYYFGQQPFANTGLRPYLALAGGLAEVRSKLEVDFFRDTAAYNQGQKQTIDAWRTAGRTFIAPTLGSQFAFSPSSALSLELRLQAMLGTSGLVPAASIGFAQGF